jgi:hypothetical protein
VIKESIIHEIGTPQMQQSTLCSVLDLKELNLGLLRKQEMLAPSRLNENFIQTRWL